MSHLRENQKEMNRADMTFNSPKEDCDSGNLVKLLDVDDDFIVELRYATEDNFTGKRVYESAECYIDRETLKMLIEARDVFRKDGYRVKIWDAYRPINAQKRFWEIYPDDNFVARPPDMETMTSFRSTHMNGQCVDITLTDMEGNELKMPTCFDDFREIAALKNNDPETEEYRNAAYMCKVMESAGFGASPTEWWHFYDNKNPHPRYLDYRI